MAVDGRGELFPSGPAAPEPSTLVLFAMGVLRRADAGVE